MRLAAWLVMLALATWACAPVSRDDTKPDCADDEALCPTSLKTATRVACNCECRFPRLPLSRAKTVEYAGKLIACLPPDLNPSTGSPEQRQALEQMPQGQYNQRVFKFCSEDVSEWLSLTIKSQLARFEQVPAGLACQPNDCRCTTEGATVTYPPCATPCEERLCEKASCQPILRRGGILDFSGCYCNRTSACGFTSPPTAKPPLCRPLVGAVDRRIREDRARLSASVEIDVGESSTEDPEERCE
jgi:hypothetical protein